MVKIRDLQPIDRPQEKLIKYGVERLTNAELLALVLRSGTKDENVIKLAGKILHLLTKKQELNLEDLKKLEGIGVSRACQILACFELGKRLVEDKETILVFSPEEILFELKHIRASRKEHFVAFYLDVRNRIIKKETISIGTINASLVHPREVFEPAVQYSAASIILAHNHPSGISTPSNEDLKLTARLIKVGKLLGIEIIDHIIIAEKEHVSLKERGYF
jgi:DNA repair protein RadC